MASVTGQTRVCELVPIASSAAACLALCSSGESRARRGFGFGRTGGAHRFSYSGNITSCESCARVGSGPLGSVRPGAPQLARGALTRAPPALRLAGVRFGVWRCGVGADVGGLLLDSCGFGGLGRASARAPAGVVGGGGASTSSTSAPPLMSSAAPLTTSAAPPTASAAPPTASAAPPTASASTDASTIRCVRQVRSNYRQLHFG